MARVKDYMRERFPIAQDTTELRAVLEMMHSKQISCFVVVRSSGQIAGIVTRSDIIRAKGQISLKEGTLRDLLADQTIVAIGKYDYMIDAKRKFEQFPHIDQLIVLDLLRPVGLLTKENVIRWVYDDEMQGDADAIKLVNTG